MYKVIFHSLAEEELYSSTEWYNSQKEKLGFRFRDSIADTINKIHSNPLAYAVAKEPYGEAIVEIFPYLIVYRFYPRKKAIFISSVFHTSRNPRKKFRKLST